MVTRGFPVHLLGLSVPLPWLTLSICQNNGLWILLTQQPRFRQSVDQVGGVYYSPQRIYTNPHREGLFLMGLDNS